MAEHPTPREPVLRPGRAADPASEGPAAPVSEQAGVRPAPGSTAGSVTEAGVARAVTDDVRDGAPQGGSEGEAGGESTDQVGPSTAAIEQALAESRQRKLRLQLRQCDRVLLMDFTVLAMEGWPDNYALAAARRRRDLWVLSALIAASLFLSGLTSVVPAWLAGGAFGAFVIILLMGVPVIRRVYSRQPSYLDIVLTRQRLLSDARKHVAHLEGKEGLVWQCAGMAEFNPALRHPRFSDLVALSERRALARNLTRREHVRRYLIFMLEAEKAYGRLQSAFFEGNQRAIDEGWQEVAATPEPRT